MSRELVLEIRRRWAEIYCNISSKNLRPIHNIIIKNNLNANYDYLLEDYSTHFIDFERAFGNGHIASAKQKALQIVTLKQKKQLYNILDVVEEHKKQFCWIARYFTFDYEEGKNQYLNIFGYPDLENNSFVCEYAKSIADPRKNYCQYCPLEPEKRLCENDEFNLLDTFEKREHLLQFAFKPLKQLYTKDRNEAIKEHRLMWMWISVFVKIYKRDCKVDYFELYGYPEVKNHCFCCHYGHNNTNYHMCNACPINFKTDKNSAYACEGGLYAEYLDAVFTEDFDLASDLALEIAMLQESDNIL